MPWAPDSTKTIRVLIVYRTHLCARVCWLVFHPAPSCDRRVGARRDYQGLAEEWVVDTEGVASLNFGVGLSPRQQSIASTNTISSIYATSEYR